MTAQSSTGNFSKFGTYFLYKLRSLRPLIIMNSIFALLSYPFAFGMIIPFMELEKKTRELRMNNKIDTPEYDMLYEQLMVMEGVFAAAVCVAILMLGGMFIMSYIIPAKSFRWLYRKNIVDMDYSLPVSDDTRFFGDLLAGLSASLVPHALSVGIGYILLLCADIESVNGMDEITHNIYSTILQAMLTGLFACLMFAAINLLVMAVCGRNAEARLYPFAMNVAIPVIHMMCLYICLNNVRGYNWYSDTAFEAVAGTSPLGLIFLTLMSVLGSPWTYESYRVPLFRADIFIPALLITIGCLVGAYFLIKHRRAERVGQPFVYRGIGFAIPAVIIFAVVAPFAQAILPALFGSENEANSYSPPVEGLLIAMVICTFVLYVIIQLISGKGFRRFHITLAKYAATLAGCLLICAALHFSQGMGMSSYVPDANKVQEVTYNVIGMGYYDKMNQTDEEDRFSFSGRVSEPENVQLITDMHREILTHPEEELNYFRIDMYYTMKDGTMMSRDYSVPKSVFRKYIKETVLPEAFYNDQRILREDTLGDRITGVDINDGKGMQLVNISAEELCEAFRKDSELLTYENYFYQTPITIEMATYDDEMKLLYSSDYFGDEYRVEIYPWCENVIDLLVKHGLPDIREFKLDGYGTVMLARAIKTGDNAFRLEQDLLCGFYKSRDSSLTDEEYFEYGMASNGVQVESENISAMLSHHGVVRLPTDDSRVWNMVSSSKRSFREFNGDPIANGEDCFVLVMMTADSAKDYISGDDGVVYRYVTPEEYGNAEELYEKYNGFLTVR